MIRIDDVEAAYQRLLPIVDKTPCIREEVLSLRTLGNVFLKLENLQKTGSFKIRGAYNAISQLSTKEKARGVIAASAGNHSQGVALAAKKLRVKAVIVMPQTTPIIKVQNTKALGAEIILFGQNFDEAFSHAQRLAKKRNHVLIHAFNDENVIAGQGTVGMEILDQVPDVDMVLVPVGGGGLISGIATVIKTISPKTQVIGVQAKGAPAAYKSLKGDRKLVHPDTIADGIAIKRPGDITLRHMRKYVDKIVLVDDDEMMASIVRLLEKRKLIVEAAGVAALAAVHAGKVKVTGKNVVCVLSGGNIDVRMLSSIIRQGMVKEGRIFEFRTIVDDRPGGLLGLSETIASLNTNIISIHHERLNPTATVTQVQVDVILETMNHEHIKKVKSSLKAAGYTAVEEKT